MKISTTWSSSRMATRVSCAPEEMIISLFMENAPAAAAQHADDAERQQKYGADKHVQLLIVHIPLSLVIRGPGLIGKAAHPDVQDETKTCERGDQGRAAVAHERQRDPFHRREAGRHRHVVNDLK